MHGASGAAAQLAALVGVDDANRLYRLELADAGAPLSVERWAGHERLAGEFSRGNDLLVLQTIKDWLLGHIEGSDKPLGAFLARTPASENLEEAHIGMGRELFAGFRHLVGAADRGASVFG